MKYSIDYINQICIDLGGTGGHKYDIHGLNEICTLIGATSGHTYEIHALNAICTALGYTAGWKYEIEALNTIVVGGTYQYEVHAWADIQQGSLLNTLEPVYKTVYDAFVTKPSRPIAVLQSAMLKTINDSGAWDVLDWFVCMAGETQTESRLDWKSLTRVCTDAGTGNIWTSLKGIKGNGSGWLKSAFVPSTDGAHIGLHNCCYGFCSNLDIAGADQIELSAMSNAGNNTALYSKYDATVAAACVHNTSSDFGGGNCTNRYGSYIAIRNATNNIKFYKDNLLLGEEGNIANAVPNKEIILLANTGGTTSRSHNELSFAFAGGSLSLSQISAITNALNTYNDAVSYFFDE